ncbi:hypothetical protein B0H16DRAFT_1858806 [Mycena metata]|uniref:Uncharacterized protein n=1 Tax=Mycena metata TaxID=1033252 RepID=A0AAD7K0Z8_9AGAR|nr:hypothetical protein B0H16DRAFT_1858806 [Mycena metata]
MSQIRVNVNVPTKVEVKEYSGKAIKNLDLTSKDPDPVYVQQIITPSFRLLRPKLIRASKMEVYKGAYKFEVTRPELSGQKDIRMDADSTGKFATRRSTWKKWWWDLKEGQSRNNGRAVGLCFLMISNAVNAGPPEIAYLSFFLPTTTTKGPPQRNPGYLPANGTQYVSGNTTNRLVLVHDASRLEKKNAAPTVDIFSGMSTVSFAPRSCKTLNARPTVKPNKPSPGLPSLRRFCETHGQLLVLSVKILLKLDPPRLPALAAPHFRLVDVVHRALLATYIFRDRQLPSSLWERFLGFISLLLRVDLAPGLYHVDLAASTAYSSQALQIHMYLHASAHLHSVLTAVFASGSHGRRQRQR